MASDLRFEKPGALQVTYRRPREGPNSFLIWEPHKSYICLDRAQVLKRTGWSKGTETGAALRAWLDEVESLSSPEPAPEQIITSSWGPEAHEVVLTDIEPNDNTKMVT